jgi:hypothetical protein
MIRGTGARRGQSSFYAATEIRGDATDEADANELRRMVRASPMTTAEPDGAVFFRDFAADERARLSL